MILFFPILLIFAAALLAPWLSRRYSAAHGLLAVIPAASLGWILNIVWCRGIDELGHVATTSLGWIPTLGINLSFRLDGLSLIFSILILTIGALVVIYTGGYLHHQPKLHKFYSFLLLFMGSMLGVVLAGNVMTLFVFWEMTSISSYLLIGYHHEDAASRKKALQALLVTGLGGLSLLAGLVLLGQVTGSYEFSEILTSQEAAHQSPFYLAIVILVLGGCFTKSAQVPFHFWLPNAMAAPTPVSAYLHSATMVKAGVYLMARLTPTLGGTETWQTTLTLAGATTMLLGAFLGLWQTDLKRILAYTTLSVLGTLTMLIGLGTELALQAAVIFLIGHALYKAALFMTAGSVDHSTGSRDVTLLRGLRRIMPLTAAAAGLAALSKSGFPPFFGFIGKEYVYKSSLALEQAAPFILGAALITNMMLMALAFKAGIHPYWGRVHNESLAQLPHPPHECHFTIWLPPLLLAIAGLVIGALPNVMERPLLEPAVAVMIGEAVDLKVALWHGFNLPLLLSALTVAGGFFIYAQRERLWRWAPRIPLGSSWGTEALYFRIYDSVVWLAKWQTRFFQNGLLSNYITVTVGTAIALLALPLFAWQGTAPDFSSVTFSSAVLVALMAAAAMVAAVTDSRLTALLAVGVIGFGVALIFVFYSAPDLAITQVLVETLTVVLFMFVVYRLPQFRILSSARRRLWDAVFSLITGGFITALVIKSHQLQLAHPISDRFADWSYTLAKGKNVVNVILVDFRALDTLGEVLVLVIAALGVIALVRSVRPDKAAGEETP
ncbi:MAG: putative monovalent cation/H+ antiporter subunit A [Verrucomicrobiota bacterium]